jgi:peptidoglycan/xylan/chitin deacetylase (PgdA/CDA1 family)
MEYRPLTHCYSWESHVRRLLPIVLAAVLAVTGCSRPVLAASRRVTVPSVTQSPSPSTPTPTPVPSTSYCAAPAVAVKAATATEVGPFGVRKTTGSTSVALTFDDGPDPVNTPLILDVLRQCGVKATFCLVGYKVAMYPDVVRRIVADGHTLCDHTWEHIRQLGTYGQPRIRQDLQQTLDAINAAAPGVPVSYFRAPGGAWTQDYVTVAHEMGMAPIDWDVDPWDWNFDKFGTGQTMTRHIVSTIESTVRPGSIVLSHDYQKPATTAAYRILLPWLTARFQLIALPPHPDALDAADGPGRGR